MPNQQPIIEIEELTDGEELAKARRQREQFDRNAVWLQTRLADVYAHHRGKYICIAGEELFVADTVQAVIALATTAHPEDDGWFTRFIPREKMARVYAI